MERRTLRNVASFIGILFFSLGACMADSESLLIPTVVTFTGLFIMYFAAKGYEEEEEEHGNDRHEDHQIYQRTIRRLRQL